MLVVSDLDDVFLPKPTDLLLNLTESHAGIEALLEGIPEMFSESHAIGSALGSGLQAAYKMTVIVVVHRAQHSLPHTLFFENADACWV